MCCDSATKAYLLAAGLGKRLYPVTTDVPKWLASFGDRPLLRMSLALMANRGVNNLLVNTGYWRIECKSSRAIGGSVLAIQDLATIHPLYVPITLCPA